MKMTHDPIARYIVATGVQLDPVLQLSRSEIAILRKALDICDKADGLLRPGGDAQDTYNAFSYASGDLSEVLKEYGK